MATHPFDRKEFAMERVKLCVQGRLFESDIDGDHVKISAAIDYAANGIVVYLESYMLKTEEKTTPNLLDTVTRQQIEDEYEEDWVPVDGWNYIKAWFADRLHAYLRCSFGINVDYRPMKRVVINRISHYNTLAQTVTERYCPHLRAPDKDHIIFMNPNVEFPLRMIP